MQYFPIYLGEDKLKFSLNIYKTDNINKVYRLHCSLYTERCIRTFISNYGFYAAAYVLKP